MKAKVNQVTIYLIEQDLWAVEVAGVVNATDTNLALPADLLARAGDALAQEVKQIGWCDVGNAVITSAGNLPYDHIIHAVGPRWGEGSERGKLANVTWLALRLAEQHKLRSIALPAISAGKLGYPLENCAITMLSQIIDFTFEQLRHLRHIYLCLDSPVALEIFVTEFTRQLQDLKSSGEGKVRV